MKKYLLLILVMFSFSSLVQAEEENINECMSDIYFANGINTSREEAKIQLIDLVRKQVSISQFNRDETKMNQTVDFKLAYNNTLGIAFDLLESYNQKKAEHGTFWWTLGTIYDVYGGIAKQGLKEVTSESLEAIIVETLKKTASQFIVDPLIDEAGLTDLAKLIKDLRSNVAPSNVWDTLVDSAAALENYDVTKQLGSYKNSIKLGHSAIVIAHSQGNLFTNVVYDKIATSPEDKWMTKYFYMIGVASPAGVGTGPKGIEIVTFDNDPITLIPDHIGTPIDNPLRYIVWNYSRDNNANSTKPGGCLPQKYEKGTVPQSCVDPSDAEYDLWSAFDTDIIDFHLFEYYMNTEVSRDKIMNFVKASLDAHKKADSQWETNEESNKNTCNYKVTVKHRYDPSIEMGEKVYPFNASKKLYQVNGEWVKASCGGNNILDQWNGKKDNECWMIDNVEKEKIAKKENFVYWCYRRVSLDYSTQRIDYAAYEARQSLSCAYRSENIIIRDNIIPPSISSYGGGRMSALEMIESVKPLYYAMENSQEQYFQIKIDETKQKFGENFSIKKYYYQNNPFCRIILDTQYDTIVDCYDTSYLEIMFN